MRLNVTEQLSYLWILQSIVSSGITLQLEIDCKFIFIHYDQIFCYHCRKKIVSISYVLRDLT